MDRTTRPTLAAPVWNMEHDTVRTSPQSTPSSLREEEHLPKNEEFDVCTLINARLSINNLDTLEPLSFMEVGSRLPDAAMYAKMIRLSTGRSHAFVLSGSRPIPTSGEKEKVVVKSQVGAERTKYKLRQRIIPRL